MLQQGILLQFFIVLWKGKYCDGYISWFLHSLESIQYIADPATYGLYFEDLFINMDLLSQLAARDHANVPTKVIKEVLLFRHPSVIFMSGFIYTRKNKH